MFEDNLLSSSSEEELFVGQNRIKTKNDDYLEITIPLYNDEEFKEHFRVSRAVASNIAERFEESEHFFHQSGEFGKLNSYDFTLIFLWFAGHESASYRDVADRFGIALSTLRKVIVRMVYFLSNLSQDVITWPTPEEQFYIREQFSANGFLGVVGVIDGSHVRIDKPSEDPDSYMNRKGFYSMQVNKFSK